MRYFSERRHSSRRELFDETLTVTHDAVMCDGISVFVLSSSGDELEFAATKTIARDLLKGLTLKLGSGIVGRAAAEGRGVIANDVHAHPDFYALPDRQLRFETKSVLCCPMRHAGQVVGVIELVNKADGTPFEERELRATQSLADGAARHWRSEAECARRENFHTLSTMLRPIVDVEGLSVFTFDSARENLVLCFSDTIRKTHLEGAKLEVDQGVAGWVAREGESVLVPDVRRESHFFDGVDAVSMFHTQSIAAVPVIHTTRVLAVLEIVNARGSEPFTEGDLVVLRRIANELAERLVAL